MQVKNLLLFMHVKKIIIFLCMLAIIKVDVMPTYSFARFNFQKLAY